jgi:hypothetical protein
MLLSARGLGLTNIAAKALFGGGSLQQLAKRVNPLRKLSASQQVSKSASQQVSKSASQQVSKSASQQVSKSASQQVSKKKLKS